MMHLWHCLSSSGFTGIDSEYEKPEAPELVLKTDSCSVNECIQQLVDLLQERVRTTSSRLWHCLAAFVCSFRTAQKSSSLFWPLRGNVATWIVELRQKHVWRDSFVSTFFIPLSVQDIVPVDASYEVKELYVQENKLDLAKADAETLPAVQIAKVLKYFFL